jgi:translocation and assembly module TamB
MRVKKAFRISKPVRAALVIFVALITAYLSSVAALKTRWFHDWVEQQVVANLQRLTGARVEIGNLKVRPAILEIDVLDLRFHGREAASAPPLLAAHLVAVRINPLTLLFRKLWISSLYASGVEIHCFTYRNGTTNLPGAVSQETSAMNELAALSIGTLNLVDAALYWNNHKIPLDLTARRVALLLYFSKLQGYWGSCSASPLQVRRDSRRSPELTFGTHLRVRQHELSLENLIWRTEGASGEGAADVDWADGPNATATIQARGNLGEFARALGWNAVRAGQFQGRCRATYRTGKFAAQGRLEAKAVKFRIARLTPVRTDLVSNFSTNGKKLLLSDLHIFTLGGSVSGQGEVGLKARGPQFSFDLRLSGLDMDQAFRTVQGGQTLTNLLSMDSKVDGRAQVSWVGDLQHVQSRFDLQLAPPRTLPSGLRPLAGYLHGSAELSPLFTSEFDHVQLRTTHSVLQARGNLGAALSSLQVHCSTTDFAETEPLFDYLTGFNRPVPLELHSPFVFHGMVTGPGFSPDIDGQIGAGKFTYHGWNWDGLSGSVDASPNHLRLTAGHLRSGPSVFEFEGLIKLADGKVKPDAPVNFAAQASQSPLEGLEDAVGSRYPVTGLITGRLQLGGTLSNLTGNGGFEILDGMVDGEPLDLVSAQPVIENSIWSLRSILVKKGPGTANGWLRLDWPSRSFSMELHGANFSLNQFKLLQGHPRSSGTAVTTAGLRGQAEFELRASGTLSQPQAELTSAVRNLDLGGRQVGDLQARIALEGEKLQAESQLTGPHSEHSDFTIVADTQKDWTANLSGEFTNFRLDPWLRWLGADYAEVPMAVSGSCSGSGPLRRPADFNVDAHVKTLALAVPGFVLKNDQVVQVHYTRETLSVDVFRMQGPSTDLTIRMSANLASKPTLSMSVRGNAHASVLRLLNPSIESVGSFGLDFRVAGPFPQPALAGEIDVRNLSVRYGEMPVIIAGLNGKIGLKGNQVSIVSLTGASGESVIQLTGSATIGTPVVYDISAHLQNLRFEYPVDFTSLLNGDLHLAGSSREGELSGDISVQQMFVGENFNVVNWLGQVGLALGEIPAGEPNPASSRVRLNVRVASNPEIRLVSRTLSFVATIDATMRGTVAHPGATGTVRIQQGQALIAGNHYQILRGEITLTGPFQPVPILDIEAQTRVDRYNLTVDMTGPADRAKLAYRSDPPLPTEDILSLLALGYTPQQQLMSSTGAQPFTTLGASALLSQALSSQVSGRVQQLFGISRIRIDPNLLGPSSAGGARITVEEQLSHNLTITYSTNTAAAEQRDIRLRWDLSNRISLIGERDINGVYGFEIRFRRRLR